MVNRDERRRLSALLTAVNEVLFRDWDPIGVNDIESCKGEYEGYAGAICRLLLDGVEEQRLAAHLGQLQRVEMGISPVDEAVDREVARRLLALCRNAGAK